jgi:integrase
MLGCALRRQELASLDLDGIEMRDGRWVLPDLCGKGGRVRTVAIPLWVKHGIDAWMIAAKIEDGRLLRSLPKSGKLIGDELGDLVGRRAVGEADWNRTLRRPRPAPDLRQCMVRRLVASEK